MSSDEHRICVVGLGYVGLPLFVALARHYKVIGVDADVSRVEEIRGLVDRNGDVDMSHFSSRGLEVRECIPQDFAANIFIVCVPTPIGPANQPNLKALLRATDEVAKSLRKGGIVVFESTVYPGCTKDKCVPVLERTSGLVFDQDFDVGYSPERINPGDSENTIDKVVKVVSASNDRALMVLSKIYSSVTHAGVHEAPSIEVAEAAKVLENTQRDLNIALMNELSMICRKIDVKTKDVIEAAATKWNFHKYTPGLVGGHCIGVDPYYLTYRALEVGLQPQVILSGRRINDEFPVWIAAEMVKSMMHRNISGRQILVCGFTFKANCSDIRNSKVALLIDELKRFGYSCEIFDPWVSTENKRVSGQVFCDLMEPKTYDAVIIAVDHDIFKKNSYSYYESLCRDSAFVADLKGIFNSASDFTL